MVKVCVDMVIYDSFWRKIERHPKLKALHIVIFLNFKNEHFNFNYI